MTENKRLTLGYSPCPNDTFIFHGLAAGRVDTRPYRLEPFLADVEELNRRARNAELDITKLSFHAVLHCLDDYWLLRAGGALGRGCGPIVVARRPVTMAELRNQSIAIPGRLTTAHLLLQMLGEHQGKRVEMRFDEIMEAVSQGRVEAGLVIHEGRFTYADHGLHQVVDLGAWWEDRTGLPLPLGCIAVRRELGLEVAAWVDSRIKASLQMAWRDPQATDRYVKFHAQEMQDQVIRRHIDTFVNEFSLDVGDEGERAVRVFLERAARLEKLQLSDKALFFKSNLH